MKTILAPVDFSPISAAVVREATALARAVDGRLILLTVVQPPIVLNEYTAMTDFSGVTAAAEKNAVLQFRRLEVDFGGGVQIETVQTVGLAVPEILDQAEKNGANYIVMGSHGHTAFYDLLVGSTTHGVLSRAKCPVVIVPSAERPSPAPQREEQGATA